jgi:hypothetical protein
VIGWRIGWRIGWLIIMHTLTQFCASSLWSYAQATTMCKRPAACMCGLPTVDRTGDEAAPPKCMISKARLLSALGMTREQLNMPVHNESRLIADAWWLAVCDCPAEATATTQPQGADGS